MRLTRRNSIEILLLLLCSDLFIIAIHVAIRLFSIPSGGYWSIGEERSLGETFQHIKELWLVFSFVALIRIRGDWSYLSMFLLFSYILIDDMFQVHEKAGFKLATALNFQPMLGLRAEDFGELLVSAIAGAGLALIIGYSYWRGNATFRHVCQRVGILFGGLVFCGIGLDTVHAIVDKIEGISQVMETLEDGGELLVTSALCWYGVS
ncbi:MAG TPA: hypothetical protein VL134_06815, partial [Leptolyngbya sp.]|nr:hypothetical protein [Leptolyngbya sp.]